MAIAKNPASQSPWGEYAPGFGAMTTDQFLALPDPEGWVYELHQGRMIRMPGPEGVHARIQARLTAILTNYLDANQLGNVYGTGSYIMRMQNGRESVLCPDISYSLPLREQAAVFRGSYQELIPDLVAEIVSPNDTRPEVDRKAMEYLEAGVRLIWNIFPGTTTVEVWQPAQRQQPTGILQAPDLLDGLEVIPGFSCPVRAIFG